LDITYYTVPDVDKAIVTCNLLFRTQHNLQKEGPWSEPASMLKRSAGLAAVGSLSACSELLEEFYHVVERNLMWDIVGPADEQNVARWKSSQLLLT
jgi:hypothetical protein